MILDLVLFWSALELNFPFGGPRQSIRETLGTDVADALEKAGILTRRRTADRYPCPSPGGEGCPRVVIEAEEGFIATCGMNPQECEDLVLSEEDVQVVAVVPEQLAETSGKALQVRTNVEALPSLRGSYRVGTFIPEPGIRHLVYLLVRASERDYEEAADALRTHAAGQTFAALIPTDRFVSDELRRRSSAAGIPIISLADAVGLDASGGLVALVDPVRLFAAAGRPTASVEEPSATVAVAFIRLSGRDGIWRALDKGGYRDLLAEEAAYDVFADELQRTVRNGGGAKRTTRKNIPASHFKLIRSAAETKGNYDPVVADDAASAKQIFQRARQAFDIKRGRDWSIFQTSIVENHAVYRFDPEPSVSFAFVFLPKS